MPPSPHRAVRALYTLVCVGLLALGCEDGSEPFQTGFHLEPVSSGATAALTDLDLDCDVDDFLGPFELGFDIEIFRSDGEDAPLELVSAVSGAFVDLADLEDIDSLAYVTMDVDWYDGDRVVAFFDLEGYAAGVAISQSETREFELDASDGCWWEPALAETGEPGSCVDMIDLRFEWIDLPVIDATSDDDEEDDDEACSLRLEWAMWLEP